MLWVKAFHIIFVTSWFGGLFYLPRIYVNLAMSSTQDEKNRLLLMSDKLYRFMHILAVLAIIFGLWLWLGYGIGKGAGWMHAKLLFVVFLMGYHLWCGRILKQFHAGKNARSHKWFRLFNELPVLALFAVVVLVVVKPF
jgi:protoporphyrinogen IX oxidase